MASLHKSEELFLDFFEIQELSHAAFSKDGHQGPATVGKILL